MLLDTSGLLCVFHRDEPGHLEAVAAFRSASFACTHSLVIAEFVALADARRLPRLPALEFASELIDNPHIEMYWVDELMLREGMGFLLLRLDKRYSLCDAVSFFIMSRLGIVDALTTDHHFEQAGFRRLLATS